MLPDLWRLAHRRAHVHRLPLEPALPALREGLAHHTLTDRWFHEADALHQGEQALLDAFAREQITAPKLRLFAHPLWEICLDGALVRTLGVTPCRQWLGLIFAEASSPRAMAQRAMASVLGPDGDAFLGRMEKIDKDLTHGPWLEAYTRGDGVAWCLDAMRLRSGLTRIDGDALGRLGRCIDALAPLADRSVEEILRAPARGI